MTEYDADMEHPWAKQWRIPRVTSTHPDWRYEVALVVPSGGVGILADSLKEPTEAEARIIGSYIDYRRAYYRDSWRAKMLERPFDIDGTTNTTILALTEQGWKYRRASYQHGLWPFWNNPEKQAEYPPTPAGLVALLDHINKYGRDWPGWKAARPDIFPTESESA
ncbi:hypothetical protein [Nocardia wallacei]|uniref:hypothetical protein n=1 Tax=Nocardia wallacei TaxID=480035 RepID=UPI002454073D|nr:hypothetical protein [Nocardia wallacei]